MKTFKFKVQYTFEAEYSVNSQTLDTARDVVIKSCNMLSKIEIVDSRVIDYDYTNKPVSEIIVNVK